MRGHQVTLYCMVSRGVNTVDCTASRSIFENASPTGFQEITAQPTPEADIVGGAEEACRTTASPLPPTRFSPCLLGGRDDLFPACARKFDGKAVAADRDDAGLYLRDILRCFFLR
ncbi:MAG: hypothetical protein JXA18_05530 [Chitinispirillaceae bacterium]|nr:hypothetical protein [Chitinispirillaceae bacterium]